MPDGIHYAPYRPPARRFWRAACYRGPMKPNYAFAKRQRELAKKQKKEAKQRERAAEKAAAEAPPAEGSDATPGENPPNHV